MARIRPAVAYALLVLATVAVFLLIRAQGESLTAPPAASGDPGLAATAGAADSLRHILIALAAVIVVGRLLARLLAVLGQPPVIGEVLAGILLGPSLIGQQAGAALDAPGPRQ